MNSKKEILDFNLKVKFDQNKSVDYFSKPIIIVRVRITPEKSNNIHEAIESKTGEI